MPIANLRYFANRTVAGNPTAAHVGRSLGYYTYGLKSEAELNDYEPRGVWHSSEGAVDYEDVQEWAAEQALAHKYTYTAVLSVAEGELTPEAYGEAVEDSVADYRLIQHEDTAYDHAHVLFFSDRVWGRAQTRAWSAAVNQALEAGQSLQQELALDAD